MAKIITLAELKGYITGLESVSDHDALLNVIIDAVTDQIEEYCGRKFVKAAFVEQRNGNGRASLWAFNPPVDTQQTLAVTENGTSLVVATTYSTTADVIVDTVRGIFYRQYGTTVAQNRRSVRGVWDQGVQNVVLTYTGGYTTAPDGLRLVARYMGALYWKNAERKEIGVAQRNDPQRGVTYVQSLPRMYKDILDQYRRVKVPDA